MIPSLRYLAPAAVAIITSAKASVKRMRPTENQTSSSKKQTVKIMIATAISEAMAGKIRANLTPAKNNIANRAPIAGRPWGGTGPGCGSSAMFGTGAHFSTAAWNSCQSSRLFRLIASFAAEASSGRPSAARIDWRVASAWR